MCVGLESSKGLTVTCLEAIEKKKKNNKNKNRREGKGIKGLDEKMNFDCWFETRIV